MAISYNDYMPGYRLYGGSQGAAFTNKIAGTDIPVDWGAQIKQQEAALKAKNDPLGINTYNPITGRNRQGRTRGEQAAEDLKNNTAPISQVKSQPIADANAALLKQTQLATTTAADQSKNILKSFEDYLTEAKALQSQSKEQLAADKAVYDNAPKKLETELSDTVRNFTDSTGTINQDYKNLNAEQAKTNQANIEQLAAENARYEAAANRVAANSVAAAQARSNASASATGTPRSGSGYWNEVAAKNYSDVMLPVEREISGMRINQLTSYITPLQQSQYAQNLSRLTNLELPVANTLVSIGIQNANQLAQFSASMAGRSLDEQIRYLATLGLPLAAAQSVAQSLSALASSLPSSLSQIQGIDERNTHYGIAGDYQNPNITLPTYTPNMPQSNNRNGGQPQYSNGPYRPDPYQDPYQNPAAVTPRTAGNIRPNLPAPNAPSNVWDSYYGTRTPNPNPGDLGFYDDYPSRNNNYPADEYANF